MLSDQTKDYLALLVQQKTHARDSFTSLDIANEAKAAGHYAKNRDVAKWLRSNAIPTIHDVGGMYNQTLISVDSKRDGFTKAYLYHDHNKDPDGYLDRDQNPSSLQLQGRATRDMNRLVDTLANNPNHPPVVHTTTTTTTTVEDSTKYSHDGWKTQKRDSRGRFI